MHNTWTALYKTWSKYKSVWTSLMGSNRNSTVQLTTQIFGVRSDTWQPPAPWKQQASHRLWKTGRKKSTFPRKDKCWNASECCTAVHKWFMINLSSNMLSGLSHQHPLDIGAHWALLVGRAHHKNIKAQFIWCLNKKHAVWLLCLGLQNHNNTN